MPNPDKLIIVNKGALGDFLQAWPSILSLAQHYPHIPRHYLGPTSYLPWLMPLGFTYCRPDLAKELNHLYHHPAIPKTLQTSAIFWFGLDRNPGLPQHDCLNFLQGIAPGQYTSPRDIYAKALSARGILFSTDWLATWQRFFCKVRKNHPAGRNILIFPGAGHPSKKWPLSHYIELSQALIRLDFSMRFALGPVELEQGLDISQFDPIRLELLADLQTVLTTADLVIGNDSGPMHLAGFMGVQSLTLFGPTSAQQWGPINGQSISLDYPCSPCSQTGRIECREPRCLKELDVQEVINRALTLLTDSKKKPAYLPPKR